MNLSATIDIDRPASEVFAYVMAVTHDAEWRSGVVEAGFTSDGVTDVGTTGYDKVETNGRQSVVTWTIIDFEPDSHARWTLDTGSIRGTGGYVCERAGTATRFTLEAHVGPAGWYRLLGPIFGMIGRRQNQTDVRKLKAILEGSPSRNT